MDVQAALSSGAFQLECRLGTGGGSLGASFGEVQVIAPTDLPIYEGEYEVEPDIEAQTLPTREKMMADDLTLLAIPRHEVSNDYGTTFIIGGIDAYEL